MSKKCIPMLLFVLVVGPIQQGRATSLAVYYDQTYASAWIDQNVGEVIRDEALAVGYESLNASQLKVWMDNRIADGEASALIVCQDVFPDTVIESMSSDCTLRKYLDAGGKIVFYGEIPFFRQANADGGTELWQWAGAVNVLGIPETRQTFGTDTTVQHTLEGENWGLARPWRSNRYTPFEPDMLDDITVLAYDGEGNIAGWVKHFVPGDTTRGFVRVWDFNVNQNNRPTLTELRSLAEYGLPSAEQAWKPMPRDLATDVSPKTALEWASGRFAATHDIYLGTDWNAVSNATTEDPQGVLRVAGHEATTFDPGLLEFGRTYYWRVDEVNAPPTNEVKFTGMLWSFETEPFVYPVEGITASASSSHRSDTGPEKTVDGSGLDVNDLHGTDDDTMWLSDLVPPDEEATISYAFTQPYSLHQMIVWNQNQIIEPLLGVGAKDVTIEHSINGNEWIVLAGTTQLAQAPGQSGYAANTVFDMGGIIARYVRIHIHSNHGGRKRRFGLSEVRFTYIPILARDPQPADGTTADALEIDLKWRHGRDAVEYEVFLGTDPENLSLLGTPEENRIATGMLDLGTTYFWSVTVVTADSSNAGALWSFTTPDYIVVDDMESYRDAEFEEIWATWIDGYGVPSNGSLVGTDPAVEDYTPETGLIHSGRQSLPIHYDNSTASYSEVTRELDQDWALDGFKTLRLYFYGQAQNTGQLYIKVNGSQLSYDDDPADIARTEWQEWNIDLAPLGSTILRNVQSLTVGVEGAGTSGAFYIDDITLHL